MLNFAEIKERIAKVVSTEDVKIVATDVTIGFLTRVYEITFAKELGKELTKAEIDKIVTILSDGVVRTVDYVGADKRSVIIAYHMN